jgi:hypothetical protein
MGAARRRKFAIARGDEPDAHELARLYDIAEAEGCAHCHEFFAAGTACFVVRSPVGAFSIRCADCRFADAARPALVIIYARKERWSEDDRAWFATHPGREWRLREPIPGELSSLLSTGGAPKLEQWLAQGGAAAIVVRQHAPGVRTRQPILRTTGEPLDSFTDAGILRTVVGLAEDALAHPPLDRAAAMQAFDAELTRRVRSVKPFIETG